MGTLLGVHPIVPWEKETWTAKFGPALFLKVVNTKIIYNSTGIENDKLWHGNVFWGIGGPGVDDPPEVSGSNGSTKCTKVQLQ